jgi:hypothetical protein
MVALGFLLVCVGVFVPALYGFEPVFTGGSLDLKSRVEYNRSFLFCYGGQAEGSLEFNNRYAILGGLSSGRLGGEEPEINAFVGHRYLLPVPGVLLRVNLTYLYNGIPGYSYESHSLIPFASIEGKYGGFSLGNTLRFTVFSGSPSVFEPVLAYHGFINIINNRKLRLSIGMANFSPFAAGNFGSYYFTLESLIRLSGGVALVNEFDSYQTGSVGLTAVLYGVAWRGGVRLTW